MAVVEFATSGTIPVGTSVSFQPAASSYYSFKRGSIGSEVGAFSSIVVYQISSAAPFAVITGTTVYHQFGYFNFNESGWTVRRYDATATNRHPYSGSGGTPFSVASNDAYPTITVGVSAAQYALIGVSMT